MLKKITVILLIVCLALGVLAGCNRREIDKQTHDTFLEVLPNAKNFSKINLSGYTLPSTVKEAYYDTEGAGFVIKVVTRGYRDGLTIIVGIDNNGVITGAKCIESNESWGLEQTLGYEFIGKNIKTYVDVEAGATSLTVNGYRNAVGDALKAWSSIRKDINTDHSHGNNGNGGNVIVPDIVEENEYTLGMGTIVSFNNSRIGLAEIDVTVATVVLDKDSKIVACRIDALQNKVDITDGYVTLPSSFKTKTELGYSYGMTNWGSDNNGDGIVLEWFEQAKVFEKYVVGKTAREVNTIDTMLVNGHYIACDNDLLAAGCTIQITDFVDAVVKACNDDQAVSFTSDGSFILGLGINSYDDGSYDAEYDDGMVKVYSDMAAVVMKEGKIIASLNDAIQPNITFDWYGIVTDTTFNGTKRELKEKYGMSNAINYGMDWDGDGKVLEWYQQSAAFSQYVVGKTPGEVDKTPMQYVNGYLISSDDDLLSAGCTIQISAIVDVVVEAAENAR